MAAEPVLADVRASLEAERGELRAQLDDLGDGATAGDHYDANFADSSQVTAERGEAEALAGRLQENLEAVELALAKLDSGTFGTCETCGNAIGTGAPRGHAHRSELHGVRVEALSTGGWSRRRAQLLHLAKRFFGALDPAGPERADEEWVRTVLDPDSGAERLWATMSGPDRRHAVGVARRVEAAIGPEAGVDLLAAALLHDVGKVTSGLGTVARVPATLVGAAGGRRRAAGWAARGGIRGRVGRYLRHPEEGAALLRAAGAPALAVAWTLEHHRPQERWTVPVATGRVLKQADDD